MDLKIDHIIELTKKYQRILLSISRLGILENELAMERANQEKLKADFKKEYQDVLDLQNSSIYGLFNKILKNNIEQLEKEKQEYLVAVLAYNESVKLTEIIEVEIDLLRSIVSGEKVVLNTLNTALQKTDYDELFKQSPYLAELKDINTEITNLVRLKLETEEAIEAVNILNATFLELIGYLQKAQELNNWGKFYREVQEAKKERRTNIDKAHNTLPIIKKLLYYLRSELLDVEKFKNLFKSSEVFIRGFNIDFYSDLITDWINDDNLIQTITSTQTISTQIPNIRESLFSLNENADLELALIMKRRNELIEEIQ